MAPPTIVYVLPTSQLHGGIRVVFEHAEGLAGRGYDVRVVGPEPAPDWHPVRVPYTQIPLYEPGAIPAADVCIGTFWSTVGPACLSGSRRVFHLCQGFEGVHREYAPILPQIDEVYRLPVPKLLISRHLEPVLSERYGCRCHFIGQALDSQRFSPGPPRSPDSTLRIGVVGPFGIRSKGIPEALRGLRLARERGMPVTVWRASADPLSSPEEEIGVTDRFFHRLDTPGMADFYRSLDAYVYSSYDEEGFPLPPLEAMACGVPVAITEIRPFAVYPQDAALRYPPGEPEALVPVVEQLFDLQKRRALAEAGLAYAQSLTLDKVLDRLEAAFAAEGAAVL
ncbi:MAG TPA: glycosyltransferase family 4 protein [Thermoanaerobaculia bacterium]|nr:glycosyltransferase family 4 protein [Thermoanaerobaculia bacterium]